MTTENSRHQNPATQEELFALLDELDVETTTHRHQPVFTVEESLGLRGFLPGAHCKSLFMKDKKGVLWLAVVMENRKLDMVALSGVIGSARLSFASPDRLFEYLGVTPGSVTPFALINDRERHVRIVLDAEIMAAELANFHPLSNDATTAIQPRDLLRFIEFCGHEAEIVDLSAATANVM
jgi:Ala-tRNA(Pro) deacylase